MRQVLYFAIWNVFGYLLTRWSAEQDQTGDPALIRKLSILSGGGLVVYSLTVTFALVDWTMSVNPHWFSTMWGPLHMVGQGLSALSFAIVIADHAVADDAARPRRHQRAPARSRQAVVRVPDAVGVSDVLAVPDHLVGEPGRGDSALSHSVGRRLSVGQRVHDRRCTSRCRMRCCCRATSSAIGNGCASWPHGC